MKKETIIEQLTNIMNWMKRNGFPGSRTAITALREAIKMLQKQEEVVKCKDCKERNYLHTICPYYSKYGCLPEDDYFCADGKRK